MYTASTEENVDELPTYEEACWDHVDTGNIFHTYGPQQQKRNISEDSKLLTPTENLACEDEISGPSEYTRHLNWALSMKVVSISEICNYVSQITRKEAKDRFLKGFPLSKNRKKASKCVVEELHMIFPLRYDFYTTENDGRIYAAGYVDKVPHIPRRMLKQAMAIPCFQEEGSTVAPLPALQRPVIQQISKQIVQMHHELFQDIHCQEHTLEVIPVHVVFCAYKKISFQYFLIGAEKKVYIPRYDHHKISFLYSRRFDF